MDTKLTGGDFALSAGGVPVWTEGPAAWEQRAMLRLQAMKGAFCYDRTFGSGLHSLTAAHSEEEWRMAAQEALLPDPMLHVAAAAKGEGVCVFTLVTPEGAVTLAYPMKEE